MVQFIAVCLFSPYYFGPNETQQTTTMTTDNYQKTQRKTLFIQK